MKAKVSMREALTDPQLLGGAMPGESWRPWRVLLIAAFGEALTEEERALFTALTGREREPLEPVDEWWNVVGRRGGKTRAVGVAAAYVAGLCDHHGHLANGERGELPIMAASIKQARRAFDAVKGALDFSPVLSSLYDGQPTADTIRLTTGVDVVIRPANYRTIRGATAVAAIGDELAYWMIEGTANPDAEVLNAVRPALATTGGPLIVISSPYAKRGELYETYRRHYGPKGDPRILVAKGASRTFNPTLSPRVVERAYARDAAMAAAEYGGEFRNDLEAFVSREIVESCVQVGLFERIPARGVRYRAFVDPSGGGADAMTLAIGHAEGQRAVLDLVRERKPPFSPEAVVADFAGVLRSFGLSTVTGDRYAGEWPREAFRRHGITYLLADQPKSALYQNLLPLLNSGRLELLDNATAVSQLCALERRVARGGRESIDHPPHAHDDLANAIAGVAGLVVRKTPNPVAVSGRQAFIGEHRRHVGPADLPPPAWVLNPRTEEQAKHAAAVMARRI